MTKQTFQKSYTIIFTCLYLMILFPMFQIGNKAYPIVLGLPLSFFWVVLWIFITFIVAVLFYFLDPDKEEE